MYILTLMVSMMLLAILFTILLTLLVSIILVWKLQHLSVGVQKTPFNWDSAGQDLDDIYMPAGTQSVVILAALDISAAFETLDHTTLINCLEHTFGITGVALRWINSYVSERSQFVAAEQSKSNVTRCEFGVPQGSVLGSVYYLHSTLLPLPMSSRLSVWVITNTPTTLNCTLLLTETIYRWSWTCCETVPLW